MAKLRNWTDELQTEIRRLTDEVVRLRKEVDASTRARAARGLASDRGRASNARRRKPASPKSGS